MNMEVFLVAFVASFAASMVTSGLLGHIIIEAFDLVCRIVSWAILMPIATFLARRGWGFVIIHPIPLCCIQYPH